MKAKTVWRENFWLTDEAIATYVRSAGLVSLEMHSPIMALGNGVPAIVCRWAEQTTKGDMWRTIGLGDWLFDIEEADGARLASMLEKITRDPAASRARVRTAMNGVEKLQQRMIAAVRTAIRP
mgnify:CR=1 FL=1